MKRVRSIFGIFTVFLLIILASFLLLSWQSTANLKASLIQTAQLQTKYAATLLEQKGKEIEIEADGILYGENMQNLYAAIENNDVYEYVQQINKMKSFFQERQGRTVGMSGMTLYWPKSGREISTLRQGYFEDSFWENNKESQWKSANKQEIFYMQHIVFLAVYCQIDWKVNHQKKVKLIGNGVQSIAKIHIGQCLI